VVTLTVISFRWAVAILERRSPTEWKHIHSSITLSNMTRTYSSALRAEQAQATRRRILDAARAQFLDRGWTATTVQVIADAAAVAPATVYAVFGTKRAVLSVLIDEALAGALPDPSHPDAWPEIVRHPDQRERARRLVALISAALPRVAPFERVVREGAAADEEIAGLARDLLEWRRLTTARVVDVLAGEDGLRPGLTREEAADLVFALGGPEVHHLLVEIRGWSPEQFEAHLADLLDRLIGATTQRKARHSESGPQPRRDPQP
jgi:AcrR family transcriptional regulator